MVSTVAGSARHDKRRSAPAARPRTRLGGRRRGALVPLVALAVAAVPAAAQAAPAGPGQPALKPAADAAVSPSAPGKQFGTKGWLRVGGKGQWRSYLRFSGLPAQGVTRAVLRLTVQQPPEGPLEVRVALGAPFSERAVTASHAPKVGARVASWRPRKCPPTAKSQLARCRVLAIEVTDAVRGAKPLTLVLTSPSAKPVRISSRQAGRAAPLLAYNAAAVDAPAPAVAEPVTGVAPAPAASSPVAVPGIWTTAAELQAKPMSGASWTSVKKAADGAIGTIKLSDQNSDADVNTMAAALVYARTGAASYRAKAAAAIASAMGTESGGRTLALGRNLATFVISADLIGLASYDPGLDARFRAWLNAARTAKLSGDTLISTHETRPNNWGTMAGASRMAADVYLGDQVDLARAATVFRGWLGDRSAYAGFKFGDLSWQVDPRNPVAVQPAGASKLGLQIDGALSDDMRRGCALKPTPCHTNYAWEALQGAVVQAQILSRRGYDAWNWSDKALLRAAQFLQRLDKAQGGWWAAQDDTWQPWLLNKVYGAAFPTVSPAAEGKVMAWTDWTS